jgi:hypothetical protein
MTGQHLVGLLLAIGLAAFIWFAFRQGMKVTPDSSGNGTNSDNMSSGVG